MAVIVAVLFGVVVGIVLAHRNAICLDPSIRIGELINGGIVLAVFFLANQIYARLKDANRRETDLLVSLVNDTLLELERVEKAFLACWGKVPVDDQSVAALLSALKRFGGSVLTLEEATKLCKKQACIAKVKELKEARFKYKNLVTGGNFPASGYDSSVWPRREAIHGDMIRSLRKLQFDLNRA